MSRASFDTRTGRLDKCPNGLEQRPPFD
jgi:hypothetical protein